MKGGNCTRTRSREDAELGGFANTRKDREVRKICRKHNKKKKAQFGKCKTNPSGRGWGLAAAPQGCCERFGPAGLGKGSQEVPAQGSLSFRKGLGGILSALISACPSAQLPDEQAARLLAVPVAQQALSSP